MCPLYGSNTKTPKTPGQNHNLTKHRNVRVLGPDVGSNTKTPKTPGQNHNLTKHRKVRGLGPDVGSNTKTPKTPRRNHNLTKHRKVRVLGPDVEHKNTQNTRITTKTRLQFLGRMLQRQKRQKSTSFIVKTPVKSIGEHRKVRELPRKMNMEEVEEPKTTKIYRRNPF